MRSLRGIFAGLTVLSVVGVLGGCVVVNATYPPRPGESATSDLNLSPSPTAMEAALRAALERNPIEGRYILNLPRGMERAVAQRIANTVGPGQAVLPDVELAEALPVVHVSRVWIRGEIAEVDVLLPVDEVWQAVTVRMRGGVVRGYRVERIRRWPPGMIEAPELFGWETESVR